MWSRGALRTGITFHLCFCDNPLCVKGSAILTSLPCSPGSPCKIKQVQFKVFRDLQNYVLFLPPEFGLTGNPSDPGGPTRPSKPGNPGGPAGPGTCCTMDPSPSRTTSAAGPGGPGRPGGPGTPGSPFLPGNPIPEPPCEDVLKISKTCISSRRVLEKDIYAFMFFLMIC